MSVSFQIHCGGVQSQNGENCVSVLLIHGPNCIFKSLCWAVIKMTFKYMYTMSKIHNSVWQDLKKYWCWSACQVSYNLLSLHPYRTRSNQPVHGAEKDLAQLSFRGSQQSLTGIHFRGYRQASGSHISKKREWEGMFDLLLRTVWKVICDSNVSGKKEKKNEGRQNAKGESKL